MTIPSASSITDGSFRDPSGFIFHRRGVLTRLIRPSYREHYDRLIQSGLYHELTEDGLMIPHREVAEDGDDRNRYGAIYRLIEPEIIPMISYPYEWCFEQLKAAALLTLDLQSRALQRGMTLKDAPATNIQFRGCRPMLIDTLSFECHRPGDTWKAYRQFCQHFLAPLLLAKEDGRLTEIMLYEMDGIPLDLTSRLLPRRSYFSFGTLLHIHLHARALKACESGRPAAMKNRKMSTNGLHGLLDSLKTLITGMRCPFRHTEWGDYYHHTNYTGAALDAKERMVADLLQRCPTGMVWDFGANNGRFSRLSAAAGNYTVAMDIDPVAVENNFLANRERTDILPLRIDLRNPSPGNGWNYTERASLSSRGPARTGMALALIHHLAISNNVPLAQLAQWFAASTDRLIIEFVPKEDSMVQRLLSSRVDVFPDYHRNAFEAEFSRFFTVAERQDIPDSRRSLYLLQHKENG